MMDWNRFFKPKSIAVIGASADGHKIGGKVMNSLIRHGYPGRLHPVNTRATEIAGLPAVARIEDLPEGVDLALIAIPAPLVPQAVSACAARRIPAVIIFSSGFRDSGPEGAKLEAELAEIARQTGIHISGPNAEGYFSVFEGIAATFSPAIDIDKGSAGRPGRIGVISQSGGLGFAFFNRGRRDDLVFSRIISVGNQTDLEIADYLDFMVEDPDTTLIMMYLESFRTPMRFLEAARKAAAAGKPIVMVKVGASKAGQRAAESHTGAIASSHRVTDAVLDHYGIIRADDQDRLLDCAAALCSGVPLRGKRVAIVSASGGTAVWLSDAMEAAGFEVPPLKEAERARLAEFIPSYGSTDNPVDITAQGVNGYCRSLEILGNAEDIDAVVIALTLSHEGRLINEGQQIAELARRLGKPVLLYSYTIPTEGSRRRLRDLGLHAFTSIQGTVTGLKALRDYTAFRDTLADRFPHEVAVLPDAVHKQLAQASGTLCEYETRKLLVAAGIVSPEERLVQSPAEAEEAATDLGWPVVMKLQSPDVPHKTDAGVLALNIATSEALHGAWAKIEAARQANVPQARVHGVSVQPMAPRGTEIIAGIIRDPEFGPMIMVGLGGIFVEILNDVQMAPAPLSHGTALRMLNRLAGRKILDGARGEKPRDVEALAGLLVRLSELAVAAGSKLKELEINPIFLHAAGEGLTIVDALGILAEEKSDV